MRLCPTGPAEERIHPKGGVHLLYRRTRRGSEESSRKASAKALMGSQGVEDSKDTAGARNTDPPGMLPSPFLAKSLFSSKENFESILNTTCPLGQRNITQDRFAGMSRKPPEIKTFNKWGTEGIEIADAGLEKYLSLKPILMPHSGGRHEHKRFRKSALNVTERLANNMMRHGRAGGRKAKAVGIVRNALEIVQLKTGKNPIEMLTRAIVNSAPAEDVTRIAYGGIVYPISVDISPQRRIDLALRFMTDGARKSSFSNPKTVDECLAEEIMYAAQRDNRSFAVRKRDEMERVALASR